MFPSDAPLLHRLLARGTLVHVQALLMLAALGRVRDAAEAIGVSPAALEETVSELEDILETDLFRRRGGAVEPTPDCCALLPHARQAMGGLAAIADTLEAHQRQWGLVRVLASEPGARSLLLRTLPAFTACHAWVQVQWREAAGGEDLAGTMERSEVDLVIGRRPLGVPAGWDFRDLLTERFVAVCAPDHPLMQADWKELRRQAWLLPPAGSAARRSFDAWIGRGAGMPESYCVVPDEDDITDWLMRDRELLAFVAVSAVRHQLLEGELVQVGRRKGRAPLELVQPRSCNEATLLLAKFLQQFAAVAATDADAMEPFATAC